MVQEHDAVRAGTPLSDGSVTPGDILAIMGPTAVQEYIVNQIQDVYRLQGVAINDKHFEVVVRQMMRKVRIDDPGDTTFLEQELVDKLDFAEEMIVSGVRRLLLMVVIVKVSNQVRS